MPELSRFYGIIIKMYFNDTQQHHCKGVWDIEAVTDKS